MIIYHSRCARQGAMKFRCVVGKTMLPLRPQPRSGSKAFILDRVTLLVPTAMTTAPCAVNRVYTSSSDTQKTPVEQLSRSHCIGEDPGSKVRCPNAGPANKSQNQHMTSGSKSIHFPTALGSTSSMSNHNF